MKKKHSTIERTLESLSASNNIPKIWFAILLLIYIVSTVFVMRTSQSDGVIMIFGQPVPIRSTTGALSSIANLSLIFLVVFFKKPGFIVSLVVLLSQFPVMFFRLIILHNFSGIAGFFSNIMVLLAICFIYANNRRVEKIQARLRNQAITDRLTGLPNRFACSELMNTLVKRNEKFAIAFMNLNNFKKINNTLGQNTGNEVIIKIASRLRDAVDRDLSGTNDFITCQGGDEFCLIIRGYRSDEEVLKTLRYYQSVLEEKTTVDDCDFFLTSRIGYAEYPNDADDSEALFARALKAVVKAKTLSNDSQICRFTADLMRDEYDMETERIIRNALENGTFGYNLQPQYSMSHKLRGFEVLARLNNPDGSPISPTVFIPVAENAGLVDKIDCAVFRESARFFGDLVKRTHMDDITLSINVSVRHLMKNDFLDELKEILESSGLPAGQLEIEITESILIDSFEKALHCLNDIKKMGIKIAIDDFGTGYSSLSYLNTFPADLLKIDKSFIDTMNTGDSSKQYVAAIISIGHVMNFDVIAEGVEEDDQLETLRSIGCDYIQGFLWGHPLKPEAAEALVLDSAKQLDEQ